MAKNHFAVMLRRLLLILFGKLFRVESLPANVASAEGFTRFLLQSSLFARETGRVKPPALMPSYNKDKGRLETSIHRTDGMRPDEIWALGYHYVENLAARRRIQARASGVASVVTGQGLQFDVNGDPYPRHVDIVGWPPDEKHQRMMKATEIARGMRLEMDPRQPG